MGGGGWNPGTATAVIAYNSKPITSRRPAWLRSPTSPPSSSPGPAAHPSFPSLFFSFSFTTHIMSSPYPAYGNPRVGANDYIYPPNGAPYDNLNSHSTIALGPPMKNEDSGRRISRTPSPTPSEAEELSRTSVFDWKTLRSWRFWIRKEWIWYYVLGIVLTVITALITIFHTQIVDKLTPATHWIKDLPAGWVIPIAILFVISFPPLFGHEIIAILCGVVWGLWIGFAIVAAGTFVGELGNFYAFKWCCRARGEKLERTNITYACLARVVREGGFKIALIARFSAIPGHFTTAVFSTCGMGVITFSLAALFSLPKQFVTVYLGVLLEGNKNSETTGQRVASYSVIAITTIVTIVAVWYIYREVNKVKPMVIYDRRKARQEKMDFAAAGMPYGSAATFNSSSTVSVPFNPRVSDSDIPLHSYDPESQEYVHQQWDSRGHAVGYAGDARLHAPKPQRASTGPTLQAPSDEQVGVQYPTSPRDDGRIPVRQASGDSWEHAQQQQPHPQPSYSPAAISTPPVHSAYPSFPPPPSTAGGPPLSPPSANQYASYPAGGVESSALPTPPFGAASSPRTAPVRAGSAATYYTGAATAALPARTFSPPPPSYMTNAR
ncbi:hypothetical protein FA95DRAFT_1555612 [Auriscalpium vulgare]|uniref:Uncharacterized protein n=1 Tax=Auriscalpium vulgare TaxID=40419 RepID=A0ACB8S343_9AGAM|nr:hypothetical protein FA95DRAFT_1555612 [Auriscalpium vulgare]